MSARSFGMTVRPVQPLVPFVRAYQGYELSGFAPGVHLGLPSTTLTLIIPLDEKPAEVSIVPGAPAKRFDALASGLHTRAAAVVHDGSMRGVQVDLWPAAARTLFGMPAAELAGQLLRLPDVLGDSADELVGRLREASDWPARFQALNDVFARRVADEPRADSAVERAWALLTQGKGARVADVADRVFWSRRQLTAKFTGEYGIGPKEAARIARFARTVDLLRANPAHSLTDVAHVCGYSDQSHLSREWNGFTGSSLTAWLRDEEFPFVQDEGAASMTP